MLQPLEVLGARRLIWLQQGIYLRQSGLNSTGRLSAVCCTDGLQQETAVRGSL